MNRRIGWMSALILSIASPAIITPLPPVSALSVINPKDANELIQKSDLIVVGDVQDSIETAKTRQLRDQNGQPIREYSTVRVKVRKVFKGNAATKEITVGQHVVWVKRRDGTRYVGSIDRDVKPFQKARYLLFLQKGIGVAEYFPVGIVYGKYNLDGKDDSEENLQWTGFQEIRKAVRARFKE